MTLTYGSVCSGIEAATMAWEPLGWKPAFFSEIDRAASMVLAHHYGSNLPGEPLATNGVPNHGDFTQIPASAGPVDLLAGGTPCQSFSVAGKRLGLDDPRGNLAIEYVRLARRLGARWLVWENVPGVLSSNGGRDFATFLGLLVECGYGVAWRVLDAQYVRTQRFPWAVPQRRRRVFLVGYLGDWRRAAAVLFEPEGMRRDPPPRREAGQGVAPTISARTSGGGGLGTDFDCDGGLIPHVSPALKARDCKGPSSDGDGDGAPLIPCASASGIIRPAVVFDSKGTEVETRTDGATPTLRAMASADGRHNAGGQLAVAIQERATSETQAGPGGLGINVDGAAYTLEARHHVQAVAFAENQRNELREMPVSGALSSIRRGDAKNETILALPWAVRRLTPRECERLQGLPDDYTLVPGLRGKPMADGPRYKMLGDSMARNAMAWIGERIDACEAAI
jgi:DNA (cytosine-5)-methyltransferase 1